MLVDVHLGGCASSKKRVANIVLPALLFTHASLVRSIRVVGRSSCLGITIMGSSAKNSAGIKTSCFKTLSMWPQIRHWRGRPQSGFGSVAVRVVLARCVNQI